MNLNYSLTAVQNGVSFECMRAPDTGIYLAQRITYSPEPVGAPALENALNELANRHEALKVAVHLAEHGSYQQSIHDRSCIPRTVLQPTG